MNTCPELVRFGANLRRLRKCRELSQEQLAEKAECHRNYLGAIERGERNLSLTRTIALARALDCKVSDLFEGLDTKGGL